ncbi:MAG: hypothetical protein LRS43_00450 [Desulfurococcales archaeon]|jgi:hypothetical protein|nr:hypothetical protein [Desulfurococcales archaeon]
MPEKLKFFDVKAKKPFETDKYEVEIRQQKSGRKVRIAFAKSPYTGIRVARILGPVKE